jgi:hypothetical protein
MYVTDTQRVERLLLPHIMLGVLHSGVNDRQSPDCIRCNGHLVDASLVAVEGLTEKKRNSLIKRMIRLHDGLLEPYRKNGARVDKVGLITYYILKAVTDTGYMEIVADSAMDKAMAIMLPALTPSAQIERLDASAQRAARKLLTQMQEQGYFKGVVMEEDNG